jgi:hypothetical protein
MDLTLYLFVLEIISWPLFVQFIDLKLAKLQHTRPCLKAVISNTLWDIYHHIFASRHQREHKLEQLSLL